MVTNAPVIGVLALQGCVQPHRAHLEAAGAVMRELRCARDFTGAGVASGVTPIGGLIFPGGESTTMLRLIDEHGLEPTLREWIARVSTWGICAGAILLADEVRSPAQRSLGALHATVERNAYGRQRESFHATLEAPEPYDVCFIRAPRFIKAGADVEVRARGPEGEAVWLEQGHVWATSFHPELSEFTPSPWHREFVDRCRKGS